MGELRKARKRKELMEWIISLVIVLVVAFAVRNFVFGVVIVKGSSMEPTFEHNDVTVINKFSYLLGNPKQGDIVVCSYDKGTAEENIIKRVIGIPGDVIDIETGEDYEYIVLVNGQAIAEPYLKENMEQSGDIEYPYTVPEGSYFVMGDNRNNSNDSRSKLIGAIPKSNIAGKVAIRVMPFERAEIF